MDDHLSDLLSVNDAIARIDSLPVSPRKIRVSLAEAREMVLAEDIAADRDYPPFEKSLMDGYAVCSADVTNAKTTPAGVTLTVVGESAAGRMPGKTVGAGEAMAVMTGAPIPAGADAVVPIEDTDSSAFISTGGRVTIKRAVRAGESIAHRGDDVRAETIVLAAGTWMGAAQIAAAAFSGAETVWVYERPRCAVLASGDEIVGAGQTPGPAQIRNSNSPMLLALLGKLNCTARNLGIVADNPDEIAGKIHEGLADDFLFISGGMSMGQYDYVPRILAEMGGDMAVTKLRIRPGKPFVLAAMPGGKYVFGLPGNPVSAFVCAWRLASRLLARQGGGKPSDRLMMMPLAAGVGPNGPREFYQPATMQAGRLHPLKWKGSADLFALAAADCLIIRPENAPAAAAGEMAAAMALY